MSAELSTSASEGHAWSWSVKDPACDGTSGCSMDLLGNGCCRTADPRPGFDGNDSPDRTFDQTDSIDQCLAACEADSTCVAVEYRLTDRYILATGYKPLLV